MPASGPGGFSIVPSGCAAEGRILFSHRQLGRCDYGTRNITLVKMGIAGVLSEQQNLDGLCMNTLSLSCLLTLGPPEELQGL